MRKVRISSSTAIGALATLDVNSGLLTPVAADKIRLMTLDGSWSWSDKAAIDGAMEFGVAHSDYSAAEIEECLEATGSFDLGDMVSQEQANRKVRTIGTFGSGPSTANSDAEHNDGRPVKTKLNWLLSAGDSLNVWFRNGSGTVYTTGSAITFSGNLWVKD